MDRRMIGTKNPGCCGEVAVSRGSTVLRNHFSELHSMFSHSPESSLHCLICTEHENL